MPATRKSHASSGPATKGSQKTLAFSSKVTKSTPLSGKDKTPTSSLSKTIDVGHISSKAAVEEQAKVELERIRGEGKKRTEEELKAEKVTDAQIRKYWKAKEAERKAPRVHQEGLGVEEKVLRLFDMSSQYGPCIGIARMKRWVRANKLGLSPPIEVLAVLLKEEDKGNNRIERAYVDELMSSRLES